jgi:hypothetical protein
MDVYRIGVTLAMGGNVPQTLSAISRQLLHVHTQVNQLQGGFNRLGMAIGGAMTAMAGSGILRGMAKVVEHGNELVKIQRDIAQAGVKAVEVQEAYAKAWELTAKYKNMSAVDILKMQNDARQTFGDQHMATHEIEPFVRAGSFLRAFQGKEKGAASHDQLLAEMNAALKSGELAGKIKPEDMKEHVNLLTAMKVAFGSQVKIQQYLTAQRAGGVALRNTDDAFRYGIFPALVQENGPNAGVMLMTAFNKIVAGTGIRTDSARAMADMGLLDERKVEYDKTGRVAKIGMDGIKGGHLFATNPAKWVMEVMKPLLDAKVGNDPIAQSQWISKMFPDRNAAKAITEVIQQFPKLEKDAQNILKVLKDFEGYTKGSWDYQLQSFHTQWKNFLDAMGAPLVKSATENLEKINNAMVGWSQWASRSENADFIVNLGKGIVVLGAAFVGAGAAAIMLAIGPAGWLVGGLVALGAAFLVFEPQFTFFVENVKKGAGIVADAATTLITEITSWPARLTEAITGMGTQIVAKIKEVLGNLFGGAGGNHGGAGDGLNPDNPQFYRQNFRGGANDNHTWSDIGQGRAANNNAPFGGGRGSRSASLGGGGSSGGNLTGTRAEVRDYLRNAAIAHGINPDVAARVMNQESGFNPNARNINARESSYGVFQLNTKGGLGAVALRHGIDPRDPSQWRKHIDFSLGVVKKDGWRQWYGARDVGISRWQGIGKAPAPRAAVPPPPKDTSGTDKEVNLFVDGRKMAHAVTRHQIRGGNRPAHGAEMSDYTELYPQVA